MAPARTGPLRAVTDHGGSLSRAAARFPQAPEPWIDLSTGSSPFPYPLLALPATAFRRLPEDGLLRELADVAASAYGAPSGEAVVVATAKRLRERLGPWVVSGPALHSGLSALADQPWQTLMRHRLAAEAIQLDRLLESNGLIVEGGTHLFRYLRSPHAQLVFRALGRRGILIRNFECDPYALRFGLPEDGEASRRLSDVLSGIQIA